MPLDINAFASVRLPRFWRHSPQRWFTHAKAIFHNQLVRSDRSCVNHVLAALNEDGVRTIGDLLGTDVQYSAVKSRLITAYDVPQATRFRTIIQHGGTGDLRPSQMLRNIRSTLPDGVGESTSKEFWLQKLPPTILAIVSGLDGPLAERADLVADASAGHDVTALSREPDRLHSMENAISALAALLSIHPTQHLPARSQDRSRSKSRNRSKSRTGHTRNDAWCFYHTTPMVPKRGNAATHARTSRKTDGSGGSQVNSPPAAHHSFVTDVHSGGRFLIDSWAEISVIPPGNGPRRSSDIVLNATNGPR